MTISSFPFTPFAVNHSGADVQIGHAVETNDLAAAVNVLQNEALRLAGLTVTPEGGTSDDSVAAQAAFDEVRVAGGGTVLLRAPTTYTIPFTTTGLQVPDNCSVIVELGATVLGQANSATGSIAKRLFGQDSSTPTNIVFSGGGLIDGNRRNGNHGAGEFVFGIWLDDAIDCRVEGLRFDNFRGDAVLFEHVATAGAPKNIWVLANLFHDVGVEEIGDLGNARQGVAFTGGTDLHVHYNHFDSIGAIAIDFEGNNAGDHFDGIYTSGNSFRNVPSNLVGATTPGTIARVYVEESGLCGGVAPTPGLEFALPAATGQPFVVDRENFIWDAATKRLGINTNGSPPSHTLEVDGPISIQDDGTHVGVLRMSGLIVITDLRYAYLDRIRWTDGANDLIRFATNGIGLFGAAATGQSTGWGAPTGVATKTTFDTATVTLEQLAQRVKALLDYLLLRGDFHS